MGARKPPSRLAAMTPRTSGVSRVLIQSFARSLLLCLQAALWQVPAAAVENSALKSFLMRSWDAADGLPEGRIGALARSGDGYLWLISGGNLVRFDGARFSTLDAADLPGANHAAVTSLMVDGAGELWIGTATGALLRRRTGAFEMVYLPPPGAVEAAITSLAQDRDGTLWMATEGSGVIRYRPDLMERFDAASGLPSNRVDKVAVDPQGGVWAVSDEQLSKFGGKRWEIWNRAGLPPLKVITPGRDSGLWVATVWPQALGGRGGRVLKADGNRVETELSPYPWPQDTYATCPACLLSDSAGRLWIGSYGSALRYWSVATGWEDIATHGPLARLDATCLAEDRDGAIYVGTAGGVLYQFRSRGVTTVELPPEAEQNFITASGAGSDGSVWIGTDGAGVFRYRAGKWTRFSADQGLRNSHIGCGFEDRHGRLWVGTWGGLHEFRDDRFEPTPGPEALRAVGLALCDDLPGNLWAGTGGGDVREGGDGNRGFGPAQCLEHKYLSGAPGQSRRPCGGAGPPPGLVRLRRGPPPGFGVGQWKGGDTIRAVLPDASGDVWIATFGNGLVRFHDGRFSQWTTREGLPSNELVAVTEDHRGNLWLASSNGIFGCPKSHFAPHPRQFEKSLLGRHFTIADGLAGRRCSGVGQPVVAHSPDGRLWFPNDRALAVFDPVLALAAMPGASACIEETLADGTRLEPRQDGVLQVASNCRRFEFRYTAPDLHVPGQIRFRHRLSGLDDGWIDTGDRRSVVYGRLPPGAYEFAVMAGGPDGAWHQAAKAVRLEVLPQVWERAWVRVSALLLLLALVAAIGWGAARVRLGRRLAALEHLRKLDQERQRIAANIHDDLGASLTRITLLSEIARERAITGGLGEEIEQISTTAHDLTQSMDEIVWAVNPAHDTLNSLASYLGKTAQDLLRSTGIRCRLALPADLPAVTLDGQVRHNLFLAVKESVHNAIKHAHATEVRLQILAEASSFTLTIADNGCGLHPPGIPAGAPGRIRPGNGLWSLERAV